jgi:hypothetical protein
MNIVTLKEMLKQFKDNGIRNGGKNIQSVLNFQDIIGRSTPEEIRTAWKELESFNKNIFLWSCSCCLSFETMVLVIETTIGKDTKEKYRKQWEQDNEEIENQYNILNRKENELNKKAKEIENIIQAQKDIQAIVNNLYN